MTVLKNLLIISTKIFNNKHNPIWEFRGRNILRPISVCLVQMGNKGLELVKAFPNVLPKALLDEIVYKSMPLAANEGDFTTNNVDHYAFSSYIFTIPGESRLNLASLVAIYESLNYDHTKILKIFSFMIRELKKRKMKKIDSIKPLLPSLLKGFESSSFKFKLNSDTLNFEWEDDKEVIEKNEDFLKSFREDVWG
jgi:hypothetical protein